MEALSGLSGYVTPNDAADHPDVPYGPHWIRKLAMRGDIKGVQIGEGRRGMWLVHLPSLIDYANDMKNLGDEKFNPHR